MRKCTKCKKELEESSFYGKHPHCKTCQKRDHKKYYDSVLSKNPQKRRDYSKKWRESNRERYRELSNESHRRRRLKTLQAYSGQTPKCSCCGEKEIKFLSIDHINGGGNKHRKSVTKSSGLMGWLIKNNYPVGFQVLCHNCNFAKGHYGKCPHIKNVKTN